MADTNDTGTTAEPLVFSLEKKTVPVTIDNEKYVLVELDGALRDKFLNNLGGRLRTGTGGQPAGLKNFDGLQADLVAKSLFKLVNGEHEPVKEDTIQRWPGRVIAALFKEARTLSALNLGKEDDKDQEGND